MACVITTSQTKIVIRMLIPKAGFNCCLFISVVTNRPEAQQQLSLISAITADLEASSRKGAKGFVFFLGNLQLHGAEAVGEQASFSSKETKRLVKRKKKNQTTRAHECSSSGCSQK
jgi:hypothetical protein